MIDSNVYQSWFLKFEGFRWRPICGPCAFSLRQWRCWSNEWTFLTLLGPLRSWNLIISSQIIHISKNRKRTVWIAKICEQVTENDKKARTKHCKDILGNVDGFWNIFVYLWWQDIFWINLFSFQLQYRHLFKNILKKDWISLYFVELYLWTYEVNFLLIVKL